MLRRVRCMEPLKINVFRFSTECSYLPDRNMDMDFFLAPRKFNEIELNYFLENGWRKFGYEFFKHICEHCKACVPIRIPVDIFEPSSSQRKLMKKNSDINFISRKLTYSDRIYEIYKSHCRRFTQPAFSKTLFKETYFNSSVPSIQTEYYIDDVLIAVGFLDVSNEALNSVYFIYDLKYIHRSPGIFSILKEIELTKKYNLKYYYLGYYIKQNHFMAYKNKFFPNQKMNVDTNKWELYKKK